jgi:hypothetical protein
MMNAPQYSTEFFINTDECYGDRELVTISDYLELNPEGEFEQRADGIYELVGDGYGHNKWHRIAEITAYPEDVEDGYAEVGLAIHEEDEEE